MTQPDLVSKLREALTSINPFSGGRDGDECLWCRRDYPRDCKTMEEYFLPEHHQSDCQLILALTEGTVEVCGKCGDFLAGDYCATCDEYRTQVLSTPIVPGTAEHGMNCPATNPLNEEDCTCGLRWRIELQTEREMHNAWRKRAEEAEQREARIRKDVVEVVKKTFGEAHPAQAIFPLILDRALAEQREARIRKDVLREAFLLRPGLPHDGNSAQFREGYYAGLEAYRQAIRSALKEES